MHPNVVKQEAGMCPECGMQLVKETNHEDKHRGHHTESFLQKFWITLVLTLPIFLYSDLLDSLLGWSLPRFVDYQYLVLVVGTFIFFYGGKIFLTSAYRELRASKPGMMTLIALAIVTAYTWSVASILLGREDTLFWELGSLIAIMLLGHWIEMKSVQGARGALDELAKLLPDEAEVERDGKVVTVPVTELKEGDVMIVKPGGRIPADGIVVDGTSEVNEAVITGESNPVLKETGNEVIAGATNGDGSLRIRVRKIGEETFLAGVMRLVEEAQSSKSNLQLLSDRAAFYLTFIAVGVGVITFTAWFVWGGGVVTAIERLVAVLVIACPHALGLAVPLVTSISTSKAARNGLLIKDRLALEEARKVTTVLFDKTGTLTRGEFGVHEIVATEETSEKEVLRLAASLNLESEHPLARAMTEEASKRSLQTEKIDNFRRVPGKGVSGTLQDINMLLGNISLLKEMNVTLPSSAQAKVESLAEEGKTVVHLAVDNSYEGSIALADVIKEEAHEVVQELHNKGIKTVMITGDSPKVAQFVAHKLDIDEYYANVLPDEKQSKVKELQALGDKVAMVGDGVNDAPALTQADIGIAIGAGTNVAIESAGIILVKSDPRDITKVLLLSRLTYRKMIQNLWWAAGYNIVAMPLAAGALAWKGIILEPAVAAVLMSLSTVIVALNALLFRRAHL